MTSPEKLATPDSVMERLSEIEHALWILREHQTLHFGDAHNTTMEATKAHLSVIALRAEVTRLDAQRQGEGETQPDKKLWLWKNFVDGRPEYWAFDNPYPCRMDCWDPQTLGEPCGYALFKPSREGRTDWTEEKVLRAIKNARPSKD